MSDEDLVDRLRATTEELGTSTSVTMMMWQNHSSACFEAADYIEHCHASHDAMAAEIEVLRRERDHERAMWEKADNAEAAASRRAEAAERKVEKLREALAPFAEAVISFSTTAPDDIDVEVTAGDVRRARAALAETEKGDE